MIQPYEKTSILYNSTYDLLEDTRLSVGFLAIIADALKEFELNTLPSLDMSDDTKLYTASCLDTSYYQLHVSQQLLFNAVKRLEQTLESSQHLAIDELNSLLLNRLCHREGESLGNE